MEIRTMKPPPPSPFNSIKKYMHKPLHIISIQGGDLHNMSLGTTSEQPKTKKGLPMLDRKILRHDLFTSFLLPAHIISYFHTACLGKSFTNSNSNSNWSNAFDACESVLCATLTRWFQKQEILENTSDKYMCLGLGNKTRRARSRVSQSICSLKVRSHMIIVEHFKNTVYLNGWTQRKLA